MGGCEQSWPLLLVLDVLDSEHDDRSDRFAFVHQIKSFVDLLEVEDMRDHRIDLDFSVHVYQSTIFGTSVRPRAAEGGAFPHSAGDKLERPCRNFLAGFGD